MSEWEKQKQEQTNTVGIEYEVGKFYTLEDGKMWECIAVNKESVSFLSKGE